MRRLFLEDPLNAAFPGAPSWFTVHVLVVPATDSKSRDYNYFLLSSIVIFKIESLLHTVTFEHDELGVRTRPGSSSARGTS